MTSPPNPSSPQDGWITHDGRQRPDGEIAEVWRRDGTIKSSPALGYWNWAGHHMRPNDIIAYRVVKRDD
jgi:hypothetical protein